MGATVVSQGAGEIASELGLAISKKMKFLGLKAQDIELYLISPNFILLYMSIAK